LKIFSVKYEVSAGFFTQICHDFHGSMMIPKQHILKPLEDLRKRDRFLFGREDPAKKPL